MDNSDYKVLLIEPLKDRNNVLTSILIELDFQVISVKNVESALKKILEHNPDIVICQKELSDYSGFHFYNMLNNDLLKNEIPFILLSNQFNKDDLLVGMELGIDSFLFPPFDRIKISNILLKQLQKSSKRKTVASTQFQSLFEVTPFGIFEARNNKIIKANKSFYRLIYKTENIKTPILISGIFDFHNEKTNELKFLRCLNGVTRYSYFKEVPSQFDQDSKFDIYLSFIDNGMSSAKIIGLVIPATDNWETNHPSIKKEPGDFSPVLDTKLQPVKQTAEENIFFTTREKQVLKLSAKGAPIKQIASQLGISARTVEKHRSNIIHKTNAGNITEAVFYANQKNLLDAG
jgi:two-component system alkaline phosphatase synthesis response regulator PhoP